MKFVALFIAALCVAGAMATGSTSNSFKTCSDPWEVIHAGDDKLAGEYLRNIIEQVNALGQTEINDQCLEVLLVCGKKPGCVFDVTGQAITFRRHFKIRGELKQGMRPVLFNQGTPLIVNTGGIGSPTTEDEVDSPGQYWLHFEKINLVADPNLPGDSAIVVQNGDLYLEQMLIKGHNSGITGTGGALRITDADAFVRVDTVKFLANGAEMGGAIAQFNGNLLVVNTHFEDNVATEKGGAIYILRDQDNETSIRGSTFKGNRATGSSMNIGEGGAIWTSDGLEIFNSRSLGGNYAKFGQFLFATSRNSGQGPSGSQQNPVEIDGFVGIDDLEAIYLTNNADANVNRIKLRRGIICSDDGTENLVGRKGKDGITILDCFDNQFGIRGNEDGCGSDIQIGAYCSKQQDDDPIKEDDEDEDGVSCVYDCDDHDPDVRPGVGEVANGTDSNCNGLVDEWVDTDGDLTPDGYDACPEDYNKIAPGVCGCGLIDQADYNGCVTCVKEDYGYGSSSVQKEAPNKDPVYADGYWYILDDADWWWWDGSSWAYGGAY